MDYQTRNMTAARPMRYDRVELKPGDPFVATSVDAGYLVRTGRANYAAAAPSPVPVAAVVAPPAAPVVTEAPAEPAAPEAPATAAEPMVLGASDLAGTAAEAPAAPARRPYTRRTPAKVEGA